MRWKEVPVYDDCILLRESHVSTVESFLSSETFRVRSVAEILIQVSMHEASSTVSCAAGCVGWVGCSLQVVRHKETSINTK